MKKILSVLIITIMIFSATTYCIYANSNEINVYLDGAKIEFDVEPQIINGRTMVPIRTIFEKMRATVEWDENTKTAICTKDDIIVKMTVNSTDMYINNQLINTDIAPVVVDSRTLASARYVAEAFGAGVQWDEIDNIVLIYSKNKYTPY